MRVSQPSPAAPDSAGTKKTILQWSAGCIVALCVIWFATLNKIHNDQLLLQNRALVEASNHAKSFARQTQDTLEHIDQVSLMLKYQWSSEGKFPDIAKQYKNGMYVKSWNPATINANGFIASARMPKAVGADMHDLPFFNAHKTSPDTALHINPPAEGRGSLVGKKVLRFTRRMNHADGSFAGVILVSKETEYLNRLNEIDELQEGDSIYLEFDNGAVLAGKGSSLKELARPDEDFSVFSQKKNGTQLQAAAMFTDHQARLVAWENIDAYPLRVIAVIKLDNALAPYASTVSSYKLGATAITLLLISISVFGVMTQLRGAASQRYADEIQQTFRLAIDGAREGFYIIVPVYDSGKKIVDFRIEDCNERGARLAGKTRSKLIGKLISDIFSRTDDLFLKRFLHQSLKEGFFEHTFKSTNTKDHKEGWFYARAVRSGDRLAVTARNITQLKAQEAKLERMANTDALTLLPNRHWLNVHLPKALAQAEQQQGKLALLFIDLDNFKKINDSQGHKAGDDVLVAVATFLREIVRESDQVIRLGGDEFTILVNPLNDLNDLPRIANQIGEALAELQAPALKGFKARASIGTSIYPDDALNATGLLQAADIAMYAAKNAGKAQVRHFDAQLAQEFNQRVKTEQKLEKAIAENQLVLYFQPRASATTGRLCSMEALVRWQDPERGLISPAEFIPVAEESDLIVALGDWVAQAACAQLARWRDAGLACKPVSINVSARQLNSSNFRTRLAENMVRFRIDHTLLALELTESTMIGHDAVVQFELNALRAMGIELQIDDFGTGYSSLSQLQRLDIDVLKIDQSFVQALESNEQGIALCEAMISIGKTLKIVVVAEGVETPRQLSLLQMMGCDEVQGFFISPPLTPDKMANFLIDDSLFEHRVGKLSLAT